MTYRYILWDIDGTVLDFLAAEDYAIKLLFKKYNLGICTDDMIKLYSEINRKYWNALERKEMTKPEILIGRFKEFFNKVGVDSSVAEAFNLDYQLTLGDHIVFIKDAKEVLEGLKGSFVLAAVTNGTKVAQEKKLKISGLNNIFDKVFISEDIGYEKPDIKFFDFVFDKLDIKKKEEVIIIGDSLNSDIKGGVDFGIDSIWFNPNHYKIKNEILPTYEIDSLIEINNIVL